MLKSGTREDLVRLEDYCLKYASGFGLSDSTWMSFSELSRKVPISAAAGGDREDGRLELPLSAATNNCPLAPRTATFPPRAGEPAGHQVSPPCPAASIGSCATTARRRRLVVNGRGREKGEMGAGRWANGPGTGGAVPELGESAGDAPWTEIRGCRRARKAEKEPAAPRRPGLGWPRSLTRWSDAADGSDERDRLAEGQRDGAGSGRGSCALVFGGIPAGRGGRAAARCRALRPPLFATRSSLSSIAYDRRHSNEEGGETLVLSLSRRR